ASTDTLSLHDALPIFRRLRQPRRAGRPAINTGALDRIIERAVRLTATSNHSRPAGIACRRRCQLRLVRCCTHTVLLPRVHPTARSEEHTSELQSRENL